MHLPARGTNANEGVHVCANFQAVQRFSARNPKTSEQLGGEPQRWFTYFQCHCLITVVKAVIAAIMWHKSLFVSDYTQFSGKQLQNTARYKANKVGTRARVWTSVFTNEISIICAEGVEIDQQKRPVVNNILRNSFEHCCSEHISESHPQYIYIVLPSKKGLLIWINLGPSFEVHQLTFPAC